MCSICGIVASQINFEEAKCAVLRILASKRHSDTNGQDIFQDGPCVLGYSRLATIDARPASSNLITAHNVTLLFNGALCNVHEERAFLEKTGMTFLGGSDTEVVLRMYLHYGEAFLQRLRGMYAFALWDAHTQTLLCARDPLGIKPFLYAVTPQGFIFSSEIKGLLASGLVPQRINPQALYALLLRGSVPQTTHILENVHWLPAGHLLTVRAGEAPLLRCFSRIVPPSRPIDMPWPEILAMGKEEIVRALRRQLMANMPAGVFLSGGIDSSLLLAFMQQEYGQVRSFSIGFESGFVNSPEDETNDAAIVANHIGSTHTTVIVTQQDVYNALPSIAAALDHPTVDGVNSFFAAQAASKELSVVISGTGGDELFAGYPWFTAMQDWENALRLCQKQGSASYLKNFLSVFEQQYAIFPPQIAQNLLNETWRPYVSHPYREDPYPKASILNRVTGLVLNGYTRDQLLADMDAVATWHGLEVRMPLLDEDVLRFALSLPDDAKVGHRDTTAPQGSYAHTGIKRLLLELGTPLLPQGFAYRPKRGFTLPFDGWLQGALYPIMCDMLAESTVKKRGFFSVKTVNLVLKNYLAGHSYWAYPWLLMMTELWAQEVLDA